MKKFTTNLFAKRFMGVLATLLLFTAWTSTVWAATINMKATATSSPAAGGYVYVGTSNSAPSSYSLTTDDATQSGSNGLFGNTNVSKDFYLFYKVNDNYTFKGWATSSTNNSGESGNGYKVTVSGKKATTKDYYAIFARLTADKSSVDFEHYYDEGWGGAQTVTATYVHANNVTATISGDNADDFSFSNTEKSHSQSVATGNTNTQSTSGITIYFKPSATGKRSATLTLSGNNMSTTVTLTGELVKKDQTLKWKDEATILTQMMNGSRQTIMAVGDPSGLEATSFESSNIDVISVDESGLLVAKAEGNATITAYQAGNDYYNAATPISKDFAVLSKATPNIVENGFSADETCELKVGKQITLNLTNVSEGLDGDFTVTFGTANVMEATREGNVLTLKAIHAGETTVTVAQAENDDLFSASKTYSFKVSRYTPEFTLSATELVIDETATLTMNNTEGATIAFNPSGIVSYDGETGVITALVAGSTKLIISQDETNSIEGKKDTFEITVIKKTPTLTVYMNENACTSLTVYQGQTVTVTFDQVSDGQITVEPDSGTNIASYVDGTMRTSGATGTAKYRAVLSETDTYKSDSVYFSVTVQANSSHVHVPVTVNSTLYNNSSFKTATEGSVSWDGSNGVTLGSVGGGGFNSDDKYVVFHFEGIPDKLTFTIATPTSVGGGIGSILGGISNVEWYIKESATSTFSGNAKWTESYDGTEPKSYTVQLDPSTRYILLCYSGNFGAYYNNINITELKYVQDPEPASVDFGSAVISSGTIDKEVNVNWCNIAPLTVSCDNPRFTVTPSSFGNYEQLGSQTINVSFTRTNDVGKEDGTITISNGTAAFTKTIPVTATTTKRPQTITWNAQLEATGFAMNVGESFPDETITAIATATSGGNIVFESDNKDAIIVTDGNILTAVGVGNANITATQAGDNEYDKIVATKPFVVTLLQKQSIDWEQNLYGLLTTEDTVTLTAKAASGCDIEYTSANPAVVSVEGNVLTIVGEGETYITAKQSGCTDSTGTEWLAVSKDNYVIVRDPTSRCNGNALSVNELVLSSSNNFAQVYTLAGTPKSLSCKAFHGTKDKPNIWTDPTYASLVIDEWTKNTEGVWGWHNLYNEIVGTGETTINFGVSESATKIRFSTTETGTTHTIKNIQVARKEEMIASVEVIDAEVENQAIWSQTISVAHSNIDFMSLSTKEGLLTLSTTTLGEGCNDYTADEFTVSFTPTVKNQQYNDVIVITDGKTEPKTIEIPVSLYSKGLNQSISGFELPTTALTTDDIDVAAAASSELEVSYETSDDQIAYVDNGKLVILSDGEVTITATQEGNDKYDAAQPVEQTIVISKAPTSITTAPTATTIIYGQTLSESDLTDGAASVEGEFVWEAPQTVPASGTPTYSVIFIPTLSNIYATATTLVSVRVDKATPEVTTYPTASDITIAQSVGESQLTGGVATVEGTFAWKNPEERRLHPDEYTRTVVFTPTDNNYNTVEISVSFKVINILAKINELPKAVVENAIFGMSLADVELEGGSANVAGSFAWVDETTPLLAGTHNYAVVFTPEDLEFYSPCNAEISITAAKATPVIETLPVASGIVYGATLAESELTDGAASVEGTFEWQDGSQLLVVGEHEPSIVFIPADDDNYNTVDTTAIVLVGKTELKVIAHDTVIVFGQDAPVFTASFEGFVNGEYADVLGGELGFECEYAAGKPVGEYDITPYGLTSDNYDITFVPGILKVNKPAAEVTVLPTATAIIFGQTLADSQLSGGEAVTEGTFAWADSTIAPVVGNEEYTVIFTPFDTDNYGAATVQVSVTVGKADAVIIVAPVPATPLAYTGEAQELVRAGEAKGGTMVYSLNGTDYSENLPMATDLGEYTVYYRVVGDANHNDVEGSSITVNIVDPSEIREPHEIIWEQELTTLLVNTSVELTAVSSAEMYIYYISSDEDIAYVDADNVLHTQATGVVTITAYADGDDTYYDAQPVSKELTIVEYLNPTAVEAAESQNSQADITKVIRHGQLLIIRDGKTYTATGLLRE